MFKGISYLLYHTVGLPVAGNGWAYSSEGPVPPQCREKGETLTYCRETLSYRHETLTLLHKIEDPPSALTGGSLPFFQLFRGVDDADRVSPGEAAGRDITVDERSGGDSGTVSDLH